MTLSSDPDQVKNRMSALEKPRFHPTVPETFRPRKCFSRNWRFLQSVVFKLQLLADVSKHAEQKTNMSGVASVVRSTEISILNILNGFNTHFSQY